MLEGRERNQLRKLWEIVATEFVYAQTVVGLDGDVISRVNQRLFDTTQKVADLFSFPFGSDDDELG